jgi:DNA-binding NarL/FixJ family response regulator
MPVPRTRVGLWLICGAIELARGNLATAARRSAASGAVLSTMRYTDQFHLVHAWLEASIALAAGNHAAALAVAIDAVDQSDLAASSPRYVWPLLVAALDVAISAAAATGNREPGPDDAEANDDAQTLMERLHSTAEKTDAFGTAQEAWQAMFMAADPLADPADLPEGSRLAAWDAAADAWAAIRDPYMTATALAGGAREALIALGALGASATAGTSASGAVGNASARAGRDEAASRLRRAAQLAADLGARPLGERIAALADRAGIALDDGREPRAGDSGTVSSGTAHPGTGLPGGAHPGTSPAALTDREYEVLRLVAAGRTNREIAATLFISPKTASVHVSNILGKLGVASRTQAAARAHALRLFDGQA